MMEWIGAWLKQLILMLLLAGFADLLLPTNQMQRYVRTVLGLLLLMTLLTPVLTLFRQEWDEQKIAVAMQQIDQAGRTEEGMGLKETQLADILDKSEQLKARNGEQARKLLETELATAIQQGLETEHPGVKQVQVTTELDKNGQPRVAEVQVVLYDIDNRSGTAREESSRAAQVQPVTPVPPVAPVNAGARQVQSEASSRSKPAAAAMQNESKEKLRQSIAAGWPVRPDQIKLLYEAELKQVR
ncbi:stage III sporulation protein AF [Paenibacillus sp. y28]|uniref:stage III sporulation protein AF n=1 Tax=Paenibacillus sp. y28 TaxID=3129110 RepID=UPI003018155C